MNAVAFAERGAYLRNYRCYFVQKGGASAIRRNLQSESDEQARDHALGLLVGYPDADKVELWYSSRLALRYKRSMAQTPAELRRLSCLAIAAAEKEPDQHARNMIASHARALAQEAENMECGAN